MLLFFTKLKKNQKGFTLLEVLGALIILALIIPMFIAFIDGISMISASKFRNQAMNLAQEKMEELKDQEFYSASLALGTHQDPKNPIKVGNKDYIRSWTVSYAIINGVQRSDMKRITVVVSWEEKGNQRNVTLATLRFRDI